MITSCYNHKMVLNQTNGNPQGSILSFLFILYINDLPNHVWNVNDTALYHNLNVIDDIVVKINKYLENIRKWLIRNKVSLNVKKTDFMIIGSSQKFNHIANSGINANHSCKKRFLPQKLLHSRLYIQVYDFTRVHWNMKDKMNKLIHQP